MRNAALIGLPLHELQSVTIGTTPVPTMPAANLGTPELWQVCRMMGNDPTKLWIRGTLGVPDPTKNKILDRPALGQQVGGVGIAHNMAPGSRWRVLLGTEEIAFPGVERVLPNAAGGSNMTGDETDIDDDPYNPTPDGMECTNTSGDLNATIQFATPAVPPVGDQMVRMKIRHDSGIDIASMSVSLFDGANFIRTWSTFDGGHDIPPSGSVLQIPFAASELTTTDGSQVIVQFVLEQSIGTTATAGAFVIEAVDFVAATEAVPGVLYDSGWLEAVHASVSAMWGSTSAFSLGGMASQVSTHALPGGVEVQATHFLVMLENPFDELGYVDVGGLGFGPAFMPALNRDWGPLVSLTGRDIVVESDGGGSYGVRRRPMREMSIPMSWLTPEECTELLDRARAAGLLTPFFVSVREDGPEARHLNLYVRFKTLPKVDWDRQFPAHRDASFEVVETR